MRQKRVLRENLVGLLPAVLIVLVVVGLPVARVGVLAFTRVELDGGIHLRGNGLANFVRLAHDSRFLTTLKNTAVFTLTSVLLEVVIGTLFALLLHQRFRGRPLVRAFALVPWALPTAVMGLAFSWIFNDTFGVANDLLRRLGLVAHPVAWLGQPGTAMAALVLADVWKTVPFVTLIVLAGLQSVPEDVVEAARVDGLTAPQRLRHVVLPLLSPALLVALVFRSVQAFSAFDIVYVMTGGGPGGSTETVSLYAYQCFFRYLDMGYGATVALTSVLLTVGAALLARYLVARRQTA